MKYLPLLLIFLSCSKPDYLDQNKEAPALLKDEVIRWVSKDSIVVFNVQESVSKEWVSALRVAIKEWEGVVKIKFSFGGNGVFVRTKSMPLNILASAVPPNQWGHTGDTLSINPLHNDLPLEQKALTLQHEIGHLLGLVHVYSKPSLMNIPCKIGFSGFDSSLIKIIFKP